MQACVLACVLDGGLEVKTEMWTERGLSVCHIYPPPPQRDIFQCDSLLGLRCFKEQARCKAKVTNGSRVPGGGKP